MIDENEWCIAFDRVILGKNFTINTSYVYGSDNSQETYATKHTNGIIYGLYTLIENEDTTAQEYYYIFENDQVYRLRLYEGAWLKYSIDSTYEDVGFIDRGYLGFWQYWQEAYYEVDYRWETGDYYACQEEYDDYGNLEKILETVFVISDGYIVKLEQNATYYANGEKLYTNTYCIEYFDYNATTVELPENVQIHEHEYDPESVVVITESSCSQEGEYWVYCYCGSGEQHLEPKLEHAWDEGVVTKEPSNYYKGERTYTCVNCLETRIETIPCINDMKVSRSEWVTAFDRVLGATNYTLHSSFTYEYYGIEITYFSKHNDNIIYSDYSYIKDGIDTGHEYYYSFENNQVYKFRVYEDAWLKYVLDSEHTWDSLRFEDNSSTAFWEYWQDAYYDVEYRWETNDYYSYIEEYDEFGNVVRILETVFVIIDGYIAEYNQTETLLYGEEMVPSVYCVQYSDYNTTVVEYPDNVQDHEHDYSEIEVIQESTCTEEGEYWAWCFCGAGQQHVEHALGHTWGEWELDGDSVIRYCTNDCCYGEYQWMESISARYDGIRLLTGEQVAPDVVTVYANIDDGSKILLDNFNLFDTVMTVNGDNVVTVTFMTLETTIAVPAIYNNLPGTTDASEFQYTTKNGEITITKFVGSSTDIVIPAHIDRVPVKYIGDSAFKNQDYIKSVVIPDSVTNIGKLAFYSCRRMESVTFGKEVYKIDGAAFYNCISLTELYIPANVKVIADTYRSSDTNYNYYGVFENCTSLTKVTIGDANVDNNLTVIGSQAFEYCTALNEVYIGNAVGIIGDNAFVALSSLKKATIGSSVTSINFGAFYMCDRLEEIVIPDSVTSIGEGAFAGCRSLKSVTLGKGLTHIYGGAFYGCQSLVELEIPANVKMINDAIRKDWTGYNYYGVFENCTSLTKVTIGDANTDINMTAIGSEAFQGCSSLKEVYIGNAVQSIGTCAFNHTPIATLTIGQCVTTIGESAFNDCPQLKTLTIPDSVTSIGKLAFDLCIRLETVTLGGGVKSIGEGAFARCRSLKSVAFGDQVTHIYGGAFYGCESLEELIIPASVKVISGTVRADWTDYNHYGVFENCTSLTKVRIGDAKTNIDLTTIGNAAFRGCTALIELYIGNAVSVIGDNAFQGCTSLNDVTLGSNVTSINFGAFVNCSSLEQLIIPDSVISIGEGAFAWCSSLESITLGNGLTHIYGAAFYECVSLTELTIPANVKMINNAIRENWTDYKYYGVFENCTSLTKVTIGDATTNIDLTTIGSEAFQGCSALTEVYIGNAVSVIGDNAFQNCTSLEEVTLGSNVTSINFGAFVNCSSLEQLIIPDSVISIGEGAFAWCSSLESITLGNGLTHIYGAAFYECVSLTELTIPANVKMINNAIRENWTDYKYYGVFENCTSLTKVTIGDVTTDIDLITIGSEAFQGCSALEAVYIGNGIGTIADKAFESCISLTLINYAGAEEAWASITKGNNWDYSTGEYIIRYNSDIPAPRTYTVTFKDYDGTVLKTQSGITKGAAATAPTAPTRDGYIFAGWDKSFDNVTSDMVVIATYTPVESSECFHSDKTGIGYDYDKNLTYIDATSHQVIVTYKYKCNTCGAEIVDSENPEIKSEAHIHDFEVNGGWVCRCGHIQDVDFDAYEAKLQSNVNQPTYFDSALTVQYGTVYVTDEITVIGSTDTAYLIKYPLDAGGYKIAFIAKIYLDDESETTYSIYIDDVYFIEAELNNYMVVEKYTYYQIYIKNNKTGEIITYGTDGMLCKSNNESVVEIGATGTMNIRDSGRVVVQLLRNDEVLDELLVIGCVDSSRITNYSATNDSTLYQKGFAPNCRLNVFNYSSVFVDDGKGGYYKVTFDVYNDVPTVFCVASFDRDGNLIEQQLIGGYDAKMTEQMISSFIHIGDLVNGKLISGESKAFAEHTSVELKVPLGGYVDFLSLQNSEYMIYANVLSGIVVCSMETSEAWVDFVKYASYDIKLDRVAFAEALLKELSIKKGMSSQEIVEEIIGLMVDANDYTALATGLMGFIFDSGVTMEMLLKILLECSQSALPDLGNALLDGTVNAALKANPAAGAVKLLTDALVETLQYGIVLKDIYTMANTPYDYLVIAYPTAPIVLD